MCQLKILATGCCVNKLKLNQDRVELLVVSSRYRPPLNHIQIRDDVICRREHVKNQGVEFDKYFDFSEHVKLTHKIFRMRYCQD